MMIRLTFDAGGAWLRRIEDAFAVAALGALLALTVATAESAVETLAGAPARYSTPPAANAARPAGVASSASAAFAAPGAAAPVITAAS